MTPASGTDRRTATLPAGPQGGRLLGSLRDFNRDQLGFYGRCAREYGDVVPVRLGPSRGLVIYHPDAIEDVLVARSRDFIKSPGIRFLRGLLGDGLLLSEGDLWLRQRRLMQPAFHRQRIAGYGEVMAAFAARHVAGWRDGAVAGHPSGDDDAHAGHRGQDAVRRRRVRRGRRHRATPRT